MFNEIVIKVGEDTLVLRGEKFPVEAVFPLIKLWFAAIVQGDQDKVDALVARYDQKLESLEVAAARATPGS